ncbi:AmpG family muropeptide MFS transporter [Rickettsiella endosymbiont of Litargus connexus]|jgi:PAT family beta-lactamase induction signal transducer AmpG|uniref:AmpG family muropeptide MFS transporter n=1 Tax=Rickettsiella endosymbiont of Litargus connexus TaxID=3066237 RepID=UPI0027F6B6B7|nr:MFS transporter [Gammaproteobacteria bacterium]MDD5162106.1 MFS transporter [Candidatus Rickettsiella isopodorum]MDQ5899698.1 transporter, family, beta-lactamase induction signal transducer AmpG [Pseudomonadota bacterium]
MSPNQLSKRNLFSTFLLGFSSGLPLALTSSTLQAWFTVTGASLLAIGSLGLIGQPYIYKFLWAPLLDRWIPPLLGRRRGWIIVIQLALIAAISIMALANPQTSASLLITVAFLVAFLSASQDIAIDAYRTDILKPNERGLGTTLYSWGYRAAMLVSGAAALALAEYIGWRNTYLLMAGLIAIGLFGAWFGEEPVDEEEKHPPSSLRAAIIDPFKEFLSRKSAWLILLFIVLYKFGDALSISLTTPFLIRGLGFSLSTVAFVNKGVGFFAAMLGLLAGGVLMARISLFRALLYFGILQAVAILALLQLAIVGHNYHWLVFAISIDSFCNAMASIAFIALLMSLCNHRYTATQFALFSALASAGRVFVGPLAGLIVTYYSWPVFFVLSLAACLPGLGLLWYLRDKFNNPSTTVIEKTACSNTD